MTTAKTETEFADTRHRVGVYGWVTSTTGVNHYRVTEPLRVLGAHGVNVNHGRILSNEILSTCDTLLGHTIHTERDTEAWQDLAAKDSHRLVLDVDDWMWQPDYQPFRDHFTPDTLARLFRNVAVAHVVTTPSPAIADFLAQYNPNVWVVPNTVPEWLLAWKMPRRQAPTLGFQCSDSHAPDFTQATIRSMIRFLNLHSDWHLHVYGANPGALANQPGVHHTPWKPSVYEHYRTISLDIGIGPLRDTPFNRGKSALRAIEYAALGIVAVLPDLPIYRGWVEDGVTGRLVDKGRTLAGVLHEVSDPTTRFTMAKAARARAAQWTTETNIGRWLEAWHSR